MHLGFALGFEIRFDEIFCLNFDDPAKECWELILQEHFFEEKIHNFKLHLRDQGYPDYLVNKTLGEVQLADRESELKEKQNTRKNIFILPFVTQLNPSVPKRSL